MQFYIKQSD